MEKITKTLVIGNATFILTACVSIGIYLATLNQHTKALEENSKAILSTEAQVVLIDKAVHKRITEVNELSVARDNLNERNIIMIEGKLGRIEDKLDTLVADIRDIKKIVLKPIGQVQTNNLEEIKKTLLVKVKSE